MPPPPRGGWETKYAAPMMITRMIPANIRMLLPRDLSDFEPLDFLSDLLRAKGTSLDLTSHDQHIRFTVVPHRLRGLHLGRHNRGDESKSRKRESHHQSEDRQ
jgi:hypothetical protein